MKPRIGITYSEEINPEPYAEAVRASGGEPVLVGPGDSVGVDGLDGLLLAGGVDVNPALYGEAAQQETEAPNDARDSAERALLESALGRRLPVLAICRGMQLLNVVSGGTLVQHMTGHEIRTPDKSLPAHAVRVAADSRLFRAMREQKPEVNSRHHQAVGQVGAGLRATAFSADGTVEAIENPAYDFVIGVQWHPEDMATSDAAQKRLFDELVAHSAR